MKEIDLLEAAKNELSRIGKVMGQVSDREKTYKEKLASLKEMLPEMFAKMALGEGVTRTEIDDVEESIKLLEERILEIPITLKGLESRRLRSQYSVRDATKQIEKLYKSIKDKLKDGDESSTLIEQLKAYAPHVGMVEDAEEFLTKLNRK